MYKKILKDEDKKEENLPETQDQAPLTLEVFFLYNKKKR